jgi:hypothetical protein
VIGGDPHDPWLISEVDMVQPALLMNEDTLASRSVSIWLPKPALRCRRTLREIQPMVYHLEPNSLIPPTRESFGDPLALLGIGAALL